MENLRRTPTSSGSESEGVAFGLRGDLFIPVVIALMVSAGLAALVMDRKTTTPSQWAFVAAPSLLTIVYVVLVKNRPVPRFEGDFWELILEGPDFNTRKRAPIRHPIFDAGK